MSRRMRILTTLLVVVVGSIVLWKATAAKLEQEAGQVSDDSLSQGIAERWGGGLPAGFTKEEADDLERTGHLFARLTYTAAVEELLEAWEPAAPEVADEFQNLMDAHRSDQGLSAAHRALLDRAEPEPTEEWLAYRLEQEGRPGAQIILLYDPQAMVMYVAEAWLPEP